MNDKGAFEYGGNNNDAPGRSIENLRGLMLPVFDRLMEQRFPDVYREMPDALLDFVVEGVFKDSAWRTSGTFSERDVSTAIQNEVMICVHEILGRQPSQRYLQQGENGENGKKPDLVKHEELDIMKMSPLEVYQDFDIGDKSVMLGRIGAGEYRDKYVSSYIYPVNGVYRYTDVVISGNYFDALSAFACHVQDQTDRTRIEAAMPSLEGAELKPIDLCDCNAISNDDTLVGKVVVIRADVLRPEYRNATCQLRLCTGGFGAYPHSRGSACFCKSLLTGEEVRFERDEILGTMKREDLPAWAQQKLTEMEKKKSKGRGDAR